MVNLRLLAEIDLKYDKAVIPKVGGTAPLGAVRNSRRAVKQKWAVGGRQETQLIITFLLTY